MVTKYRSIHITGTGERQRHGFIYEQDVIRAFNLVESEHYTAKFDAYSNGIGVSIKTKRQRQAIELADWRRNASIDQSFYLIAGLWGNGDKAVILNEHVMKIEAEYWQKQFNKELWEPEIKKLLSSVDNSREMDATWRANCRALKKDYTAWQTETGSIIRLNPKRDHKKQLRMQCSFTYSSLLMLADKFPTEEIKRGGVSSR